MLPDAARFTRKPWHNVQPPCEREQFLNRIGVILFERSKLFVLRNSPAWESTDTAAACTKTVRDRGTSSAQKPDGPPLPGDLQFKTKLFISKTPNSVESKLLIWISLHQLLQLLQNSQWKIEIYQTLLLLLGRWWWGPSSVLQVFLESGLLCYKKSFRFDKRGPYLKWKFVLTTKKQFKNWLNCLNIKNDDCEIYHLHSTKYS